MIKIDYPAHEFRMKKEKEKELIFDELRKLWVRLTPEEWVRQNFIRYLVYSKSYPSSLVALEKKIMVGEMIKRFDILVYDRAHRPWMMVECKASDVQLKENVLNQVLRYNIAVPVEFLVITNGNYCMAFKKVDMRLLPIDEFPDFEK
ncbi:MAG: type I restriction enzyme HsdR N-terminal domain-containing protein [Chitinophagaceae bacterium]|nr:type I restriction enzyme HsdR N-terminal domain-containing protein [Chitinophagaceae bacterium]